MRVMTDEQQAFSENFTERRLIAYTRFRGVVNLPSRIWMVRDWAKAHGYELVGPPQCVFSPNGYDQEGEVCEVQWEVVAGPEPVTGEIGLKWAEPGLVVAALHAGAPSTIPETLRTLGGWAEARGHKLSGTWREIYHPDRTTPTGSRITEIQLPVDRVV
jgi:hypothetical protein